MLKKHTEKIKIPRTVLDKARIAIVRAQFNTLLTESLEKHCLATLLEHGVKKGQILQFQVPGSLEIPIVAQNIAKTKKADIIIALGVVIKGDTYHFEIVANECARGCMDVALKYNVPIIFEVIPVYNLAQAKKRAGNNNQNKGREAALAALKMLNVMSQLARG